MEIKDVQANTGKIDIVAHVVSKEEPRSFNKNGREGRVCKAVLRDNTGEITLTLWNNDVDSINEGDKVHLQNGWCSEYNGQKQLSSGKFGTIEVLEAAGQSGVLTNDVEMLQKEETITQMQEAGVDPTELEAESSDEDEEVERITDEEEIITG